jgi:hypothetical protein
MCPSSHASGLRREGDIERSPKGATAPAGKAIISPPKRDNPHYCA